MIIILAKIHWFTVCVSQFLFDLQALSQALDSSVIGRRSDSQSQSHDFNYFHSIGNSQSQSWDFKYSSQPRKFSVPSFCAPAGSWLLTTCCFTCCSAMLLCTYLSHNITHNITHTNTHKHTHTHRTHTQTESSWKEKKKNTVILPCFFLKRYPCVLYRITRFVIVSISCNS